MNGFLSGSVWLVLLQSTVRMATPYTLAAMGGLYSDKAGVSSIELEGILLMGAFSGFTAAYMTNQLWIGLAAAMISGVLLAAIYGYMVVYLGSKPALVGTAIVLLATGVTSFFYRSIFGVSVEFPSVEPFQDIALPVLHKIPVIGTIAGDRKLVLLQPHCAGPAVQSDGRKSLCSRYARLAGALLSLHQCFDHRCDCGNRRGLSVHCHSKQLCGGNLRRKRIRGLRDYHIGKIPPDRRIFWMPSLWFCRCASA